jgi:hypothetical protein
VGKSAAIVVLLAVLGCAPPRVVEPPAPAADASRLSHAQHAAIGCTECHQMGTRPGSRDHAPCDTCHRAAFLAQPGPLCEVCHTKVETSPLVAPLRPYPIEDPWQAEPPRFSHRSHLDAGRMENRVGFHITCLDCHVSASDGQLARPDHATCARCHAREASGKPTMDDCGDCHQRDSQLRSRARLIKGDLHFDHDRHRADRRGKPIRCEQCHTGSANAAGYADHAAPRVESCVACHDDTDRTPAAMRMRVCQTCHAERTERLTSLAPRNHLPATERPLDHTIAFRRDHAEAAERDAARCGACHTQMSGNPRDACDECHQSMRPSDHRITWRELDHGSEAAADRDRCARCHVVEFCTACHMQRPSSHGYAGSFVADHGPLARINVRSCLTCHAATYCEQCHQGRSTR